MTSSSIHRTEVGDRAWSSAETRVCIGMATRGRPQQLRSAVEHLHRQTLAPVAVIVSCVSLEDVGFLAESATLRIVLGPAGLARQRNAVLDNLPHATEFVVFFDDDFYPHDRWLEVVIEAFREDPQLACVTGNVIADGILGPGLTYDDAIRALEDHSPEKHRWEIDGYSPYGCNMAFRLSAIEGLRFDERLVLYGWLEDLDFGAQVGHADGRMIKLGAAVGVHLGVKSGRVTGRRLGYSQVANPFYMHRKQTMSASAAAGQALRNFCANAVRAFRPEPYVDRRGRLVGNLVAFGDILRGRCTPERAELL